jgi:hypothetical protein
VCVGATCATPGGPCSDSYDCDAGYYCEPQLGKCLKQPDPLLCEVVPSFDGVEVQLEWAFTKDQVIAMPVVANVTGDETPEVIFNTTRLQGGQRHRLSLRRDRLPRRQDRHRAVAHQARPGEQEVRRARPVDHRRSVTSAATASPTSCTRACRRARPRSRYLVYAVDGDGTLLSRLANNSMNQARKVRTARRRGDGQPRRRCAGGDRLRGGDLRSRRPAGVEPGRQQRRWSARRTTRIRRRPTSIRAAWRPSPTSTSDGKPELVTGREAWKINWAAGNPPVVTLVQMWKNVDGSG